LNVRRHTSDQSQSPSGGYRSGGSHSPRPFHVRPISSRPEESSRPPRIVHRSADSPRPFTPRPKYGREGVGGQQVRPKQVRYKEPLADPTQPIRLNKFIANAGICSRREADEYIRAGVIKVNDIVVTEMGTKITRLDKVFFHDKEVRIENKVYILLNKPKNCVTTTDDPEERMTVINLVRNACRERVYPVGRLDRNTTGVILITNDGELSSRLTHPSYKKKKIYHVWLEQEVAPEDLQKIASGIELEDGEIHADAIEYVSEEDKTQVGIEIHSGRNRLVRRIFESLGYHVVKLDRVYFAGLTKKNLARGKWRYLDEREVNALRMGLFE
jgi:23S rRNA pseudouridine2605 synthase